MLCKQSCGSDSQGKVQPPIFFNLFIIRILKSREYYIFLLEINSKICKNIFLHGYKSQSEFGSGSASLEEPNPDPYHHNNWIRIRSSGSKALMNPITGF